MSEQRQQDVDMPDPADDFPRLDREIYGQEFERDIAFVGRGADPEPSMDIATLAKYYREMSDFLYAKDSLGRARSPSGLDQVYTQGLPHHLSQAGPNPSAPGFVSSLPLRDHRPDAVDPALLRNPSPCPFPPAMLGENSYGPATHSQMVPLSNGLYFEDPARASSCACGNTIAPQGTSKSAYRNPSGLAGPSTQPENNWLRENSFGCGTMAEHHAAELESLPRPIPALSSQRIPHPFFFQMRAGPQESPHERPLAFEPFHGTQKAPSQPLPLTTHPGSQQHMDSREVSPKEHWSDRSYPLYGQKDAASHNLRTSQPMVGLDSNSALVSPSTGDVRHPGTVQLKNSRNNSSRKRLSDLSNPISIGQDGRRRTKHASRPSQVFNSSQLSRSDSRNASSFISPLGQRSPPSSALPHIPNERSFQHEALHATLRELEGSQTYNCDHCDKIFPNEQSLKRHARCHVHSCRCQECSQEFSTPRDLDRHVRDVHGDPPRWQCPHHGCCASSKRKYNLRRHIRNKHGTDLRYTDYLLENIRTPE